MEFTRLPSPVPSPSNLHLPPFLFFTSSTFIECQPTLAVRAESVTGTFPQRPESQPGRPPPARGRGGAGRDGAVLGDEPLRRRRQPGPPPRPAPPRPRPRAAPRGARLGGEGRGGEGLLLLLRRGASSCCCWGPPAAGHGSSSSSSSSAAAGPPNEAPRRLAAARASGSPGCAGADLDRRLRAPRRPEGRPGGAPRPWPGSSPLPLLLLLLPEPCTPAPTAPPGADGGRPRRNLGRPRGRTHRRGGSCRR